MDAASLFSVLMGAGGTGALAFFWNIVQTLRRGRQDKEEKLLERLDSSREAAEKDAARYRRQRIRAQDQAAMFRRMLITHTHFTDVDLEKLEEFDD